MSEMSPYEHSRMRRMADMIEATERKLFGLYREAARYSMDDLLSHPFHACDAWDREIMIAKLEAQLRGEPTSIQDVR